MVARVFVSICAPRGHLHVRRLRHRHSPLSPPKDRCRDRTLTFPPFAFTEHGAIMAATVLNSPRAVEMSLYVVRAFIQLRELLAANSALARKLDELEKKYQHHDQ